MPTVVRTAAEVNNFTGRLLVLPAAGEVEKKQKNCMQTFDYGLKLRRTIQYPEVKNNNYLYIYIGLMLVLTLRTLNIDFRHAMTQTNEIFIHSRQSGSKNTCILSQGFTLQTSSQSASVERVDGSLYGRVPPPSPCKHHRS